MKVSQAARAHWRLIIISCLVFVAAFAAYAYQKSPTYTAQARLLVGSYDTRISAIPGTAVATTSLATTYSRLASTADVAQLAATAAGVPKSAISGHISASPLVSSPIVVVTGRGANQQQAVQFANAGSSALQTYVKGLNPNTPDLILQRYQDANNQLMAAQGELNTLENRSKTSPSDANISAEAAKRSEVAAKQLQVDALKGSYSNATDVASFGLQNIQSASAGGSDRKSTVQMYGFLGFIVGLIPSLAFSLWREEKRAKRRSGRFIDATSSTDTTSTLSTTQV